MKARLVMLALAASAGGCGLFGGDDNIEPPSDLVDFEATLEIDEVWSNGVGRAGERLRLGLRPATDGARIYAGGNGGRVAAFNLETGRREWRVDTELPLSAGPAYANGMLAFGTANGELVLVSAADGAELWRRRVDSEVLAAPAMTANVIVLRTVDGRLRGFSTRDGSTLWTVQQTMPALTLRGNSAPVIAGSTAVAGFDNGRIGAYAVASGDPEWEITIAAPAGRNELERLVDVADGVGVVGNDVYTATYQGRAVGIDLVTGSLLWQHELSSFAGLGVDVNNVYVTTDVSAVVALGRRSGTEIWRQEALRLRDATAPTRFENTLVVGDFEGYLHWLSVDGGEFVARERAGSARVTAAPLVVNRMLVVQTADGTVAAYRIELPEDEAE